MLNINKIYNNVTTFKERYIEFRRRNSEIKIKIKTEKNIDKKKRKRIFIEKKNEFEIDL